ncbi:MAG: metal-dependent hydrolase [Rubricoccaceae bacterium]
MDSFTQAALGAAVGQAVAGPRVGRRAAFWGAVAGTLPDLDVVAYPFLDLAGQLYVHRGVTHGLAFGLVIGPLLGWLIWRIERWRGRNDSERDAGTWRLWAGVMALGLVTHPLLDAFTVYGTQLLAPFSNHPFAVGSLFIIDPLVTVPMLATLLIALRARPARRRVWVVAGLAMGCVYLAAGVGAQASATATVEAAYAERGVEPDRLLVVAGPLSSLHWRGVADLGETLEPFHLHLTDAPGDVTFEPTLSPARWPEAVRQGRDATALRWFSRGWLAELPTDNDELAIADVRFGRAGLDSTDPFVFAWAFDEEPPYSARQLDRELGFEEGEWGRLMDRILGR